MFQRFISKVDLIVAFILGLVTAGGVAFTFYIQELEDNYTYAKSNLALSQELANQQEIVVIQDSIIRLDSKIIENDSGTKSSSLTIERIKLISGYMKAIKAHEMKILLIKRGLVPELEQHYYNKYKSYFEGKYWDNGQDIRDLYGGEMQNQPEM